MGPERVRKRQLMKLAFLTERKELKLLMKGGQICYREYPTVRDALCLEHHMFDINKDGIPRYAETIYALEVQGDSKKRCKRNIAGWTEQREGIAGMRSFKWNLFFTKSIMSRSERKRALMEGRRNLKKQGKRKEEK